MSSTLEQIREFTTLGEASVFAVEMMDRGVLQDCATFLDTNPERTGVDGSTYQSIHGQTVQDCLSSIPDQQ